MHRLIVAALLLFLPSAAFGQFNPYAPVGSAGADARTRRALRERAVAHVGPVARTFVESYGDEAVAALFACSPEVGRQLAEFQASGGLDKLPRPRGLLAVIAQPNHGDDVALWAMQHAEELRDVDNFDAYLLSPLDYALGLKPLAQGAAESRVRRLEARAPQGSAAGLPADWRPVAFWAGVVAIVVLLGWWNRVRRAAQAGNP